MARRAGSEPTGRAGSHRCCGESPRALWAEGLDIGADSEALVELWFPGFGPLQQQSHAVSICNNAN